MRQFTLKTREYTKVKSIGKSLFQMEKELCNFSWNLSTMDIGKMGFIMATDFIKIILIILNMKDSIYKGENMERENILSQINRIISEIS